MRTSARLRSIATAIAVVGIILIPTQWVATTLATTPSTSDLSVSLTGPSFVDRGTVFTDTISLTNLGPSNAHNIVVTIKPVLGLTFQSYGSYPTCSANGLKIVCTVPSVALNGVLGLPVNFSTGYQDACVPVTYTADVSVQADELDPALSGNVKTLATSVNCVTPPSANTASPTVLNQMQIDQQRLQLKILSHWPYVNSSSSMPAQSVTILPPPPVPQTPSVSQDAILTLTSSRTEVVPGDTVALDAQVQNISNYTIRGAEVDFYFDPAQLTPLSGSNASQGNGRLTWVVDLAPGEVRALPFSVRVSKSVKSGTPIATSMRVLGVGGYPSAAVSMSVLGKLPQTGAGFLSSLEDTHRFLSPIGSGGSVLALVIFLSIMKYTVAGGLVARKFLAAR